MLEQQLCQSREGQHFARLWSTLVAGSCVGVGQAAYLSRAEQRTKQAKEGKFVGAGSGRAEGGRRIGKSLRDVENGIQFAYFLSWFNSR
jgi:hypothetical protein